MSSFEVFPEMFGAVGDGVASDGPALQAAIDHAKATSGVLHLRDGARYRTEQSLFCGRAAPSQSDLKTIDAHRATIIGACADYPVLDWTGGHHREMYDLRIESDAANAPSCGILLDRAYDATDPENPTAWATGWLTARKVTITGTFNVACVYARASEETTWDDCSFTQNGGLACFMQLSSNIYGQFSPVAGGSPHGSISAMTMHGSHNNNVFRHCGFVQKTDAATMTALLAANTDEVMFLENAGYVQPTPADVGQTVTGSTSGATGVLRGYEVSNVQRLWLVEAVAGIFQAGEPVTVGAASATLKRAEKLARGSNVEISSADQLQFRDCYFDRANVAPTIDYPAISWRNLGLGSFNCGIHSGLMHGVGGATDPYFVVFDQIGKKVGKLRIEHVDYVGADAIVKVIGTATMDHVRIEAPRVLAGTDSWHLDGDNRISVTKEFQHRGRFSGRLIQGSAATVSFANAGLIKGLVENQADDRHELHGRDLVLVGHDYTKTRLLFGEHHVWRTGTGRLRIKDGAPTNDQDGEIVGG